MPNPFKHKDAMLPIASVNSVIIHGMRANDLFRPELIQKDLLKLAEDMLSNLSKLISSI